MDIPDIEYTTESTHIVHSDGIAVEYTTESTYIFRSGCVSVNRLYMRHISSDLMVCKPLGFTRDTYLPL